MATRFPLRGRLDLAGLSEIAFFNGIPPRDLARLYNELEQVMVRGGEVVYTQGEPRGGLYVVQHGRLVSTRVDADGCELQCDEFVRGDVAGEISLLTGEAHSRTVRAARDSLLIFLSHDAAEWLLEHQPPALLALAKRLIAERRRSEMHRTRRRRHTFGVLPASRGVDLSAFCDRLAEALRSFGTVSQLRRAAVEEACAGTSYEYQIELLNKQERDNTYVLFEGEMAASSFTSICVRHADCILLVGNAAEEPWFDVIKADFEREEVALRKVPQELVLIHDRQPIRNTRRWLDARRVDAHHHLPTLHDCARLARMLTGNALGLVLSGGGARGYAHVGVLRALEEAGLIVDRIGGTSMGALLGAFMAQGTCAADIAQATHESFNDPRRLYDFTVPIVSLIKGDRLRHMIERLFGDLTLEDLPLPFYTVATNLTRAERRVHREGLVREAVLQSMSIPGIAPPVEEDGDLFCDGGLLDNMPVDVMTSLGEGLVVAVDVSPMVDPGIHEPRPINLLTRLLHGWHGVDSPEQHRANILDILTRTVYVGANYAQRFNKTPADLLLAPPLGSFRLTDWHASNEIIDIGYQHARDKIATWNCKTLPERNTPIEVRTSEP